MSNDLPSYKILISEEFLYYPPSKKRAFFLPVDNLITASEKI